MMRSKEFRNCIWDGVGGSGPSFLYKANTYLWLLNFTLYLLNFLSMAIAMSRLTATGGLCKRLNYRWLSSLVINILLPLILLSTIPQKSDGQFEDWCIADEQTPDAELQKALDWACGNGADCSKIQANQPCYLPNTIKDHASFAFNSYYQKLKHKGASCYFNAAAVLTARNPSHGPCKFEVLP